MENSKGSKADKKAPFPQGMSAMRKDAPGLEIAWGRLDSSAGVGVATV
jgi:hypothetical protein